MAELLLGASYHLDHQLHEFSTKMLTLDFLNLIMNIIDTDDLVTRTHISRLLVLSFKMEKYRYMHG